MDRKAKSVCSVVGFLGLLSAVLSFAAEATRTPAFQYSSDSCPNSPAPGLGVAAAVFLLTAQIIIIATTGGCCCCRRGYYQSKSSWAVICFVVSWIAFLIAFLMMLIGAAQGALNQGGDVVDYPGEVGYYHDCAVLQPGVFAGAAVLSLASVVLGIAYYLAMDSAKIRNGSWGGTPTTPNQSGIAMAKPQVPPPQFPPPHVPPPQFPPPHVPPPDIEAPVSVHTCFCLLCQYQQNVSRPE